MVAAAETETGRRGTDLNAAAEPRRKVQTRRLHDFSFPILKKWGAQRLLRCANINRKGEIIVAANPKPQPPPADGVVVVDLVEDSEGGEGVDEALKEVRAKLLVHLREAADRMELAMPSSGSQDPEPEAEPPSSTAADSGRPCNRRSRPAPRVVEVIAQRMTPSSTPAPPTPPERGYRERSVRLRSDSGREKKRRRFSVALSKDEIDEDIFAVTGSLPRRPPKRRPRAIQRHLDLIFPGLWLSEVTADMYKPSSGEVVTVAGGENAKRTKKVKMED